MLLAPRPKPDEYDVRSRWYLVELIPSDEMSGGGIILTERTQGNWNDGLVLKAGPGDWFDSPLVEDGFTTYQQADEGDRIIFPRHGYMPWSRVKGQRELGWAADESIIAVLRQEQDFKWIIPANDLCLVLRDGAAHKSDGGILVPEDMQVRPSSGTLLRIGPGWARVGNSRLRGLRVKPWMTWGISDEDIIGKQVYWSEYADFYEVTDPQDDTLTYNLIQGKDILAYTEPA